MTATDADRTQAAELLAQPPGYRGANHITAVAAALAAARAEHGPRHCVSVDDANRVLSEERAAHERTAASLAEARAKADQFRADMLALAEQLDSYVTWRGHPAPGTYDDGVNKAQTRAAARLRALAGGIGSPAGHRGQHDGMSYADDPEPLLP
jgi:hypothetical protein